MCLFDMLVVSVSLWLTWFYGRFLTQLIPHITAHPSLLPLHAKQKISVPPLTDGHNWNRKRIFFWSFWLLGLKKWNKACIELPLFQNSVSHCPWRWNEKSPSRLIENQISSNKLWWRCSLYVRHRKLMLSCIIGCIMLFHSFNKYIL